MATKFDAPQYLQLLKGGSYWRMARLRMIAGQSANMPPSRVFPTWREARQYGFGNWHSAYSAMSQGFNDSFGVKKPVWYCHTGEQFRDEVDAHTVDGVRMDHTGWYTDPEQNNMCIGIIARLSHGRFIAGYRLNYTNERCYFGVVYDDAIGAAHGADGEAREHGEKEYEYQEKYQEAQYLDEQINDRKHELRRMIALRHTSGFDDASAYRDIEEAIADLRADKQRFADDYSDVEI